MTRGLHRNILDYQFTETVLSGSTCSAASSTGDMLEYAPTFTFILSRLHDTEVFSPKFFRTLRHDHFHPIAAKKCVLLVFYRAFYKMRGTTPGEPWQHVQSIKDILRQRYFFPPSDPPPTRELACLLECGWNSKGSACLNQQDKTVALRRGTQRQSNVCDRGNL